MGNVELTVEAAGTVSDIAKVVKDANRSEIHRVTGISLSGVSRIMSGSRVPRSVNLEKIAAALGVPMDELYHHLVRLRSRRSRRSAA